MYNSVDYSLPGETWKAIPGYEGIYEASDLGRVRSVDGKVTNSVRCGRRRWKGRILKTRGNSYITGYRVSLWRDKVSRDYLVARLVGITFLGRNHGYISSCLSRGVPIRDEKGEVVEKVA